MTKIEAYQKAINAIDDYFEYRCMSDYDKNVVYHILDTLKENLEKLDNEQNV